MKLFHLFCLLLLMGCDKRLPDAESFLQAFTASDNGNQISISRDGYEYRLHVLNSEYFAAQSLSSGFNQGMNGDSILSESKSRYGNAIYLLLKITPIGDAGGPIQDGNRFLFLIQSVKANQDRFNEQAILTLKTGKRIPASNTVVSGIGGNFMQCSILFAFDIPEKKLGDIGVFSIGAIKNVPMHVDFEVSKLRPKLRFDPI